MPVVIATQHAFKLGSSAVAQHSEKKLSTQSWLNLSRLTKLTDRFWLLLEDGYPLLSNQWCSLWYYTFPNSCLYYVALWLLVNMKTRQETSWSEESHLQVVLSPPQRAHCPIKCLKSFLGFVCLCFLVHLKYKLTLIEENTFNKLTYLLVFTVLF